MRRRFLSPLDMAPDEGSKLAQHGGGCEHARDDIEGPVDGGGQTALTSLAMVSPHVWC